VKVQTGFALHQMKRGPKFRSAIIPPPGDVLLEFDAAGQEFRWMALQSGDLTMLKLCQPGEDPHCYMAAAIKGWDYAEIMRLHKSGDNVEISGPQGARMFGKLANLSLQFRTYAKRLRMVARVDYDLAMNPSESEHIWSTYPRTYPRVKDYWFLSIDKAKRLGYAETLAGRRVQIAGDWSGKQSWAMESTAIIVPIQGTGADQKYLALACLKPYLVEHGIRFAWDMHDGLYFYCPEAKAERALIDIKAILDNLPYEAAWGFKPSIPLPWDAKSGPSWGELK
jgi:DNA polymerase-1